MQGRAEDDLLWVVDQDDKKVYPYTISTRTLNTSKTQITLVDDQTAAFGICGDAATAWVFNVNYFCRSCCLIGNVTETLAPGGHSNQR